MLRRRRNERPKIRRIGKRNIMRNRRRKGRKRRRRKRKRKEEEGDRKRE